MLDYSPNMPFAERREPRFSRMVEAPGKNKPTLARCGELNTAYDLAPNETPTRLLLALTSVLKTKKLDQSDPSP